MYASLVAFSVVFVLNYLHTDAAQIQKKNMTKPEHCNRDKSTL